jgi:oligoribonuclease
MTGLVPGKNILLEIAVVVTDGDLNLLHPGFVQVIHRSQEELAHMNEWCVHMHGKAPPPRHLH